MKRLRVLLLLCLSLAPIAFTGCVAVVAAGAAGGTVAYLRGDLSATLSASMRDSQRAVIQALQTDLRLVVVSTSEDSLTAEYVARTAQDDKVVIRLNRASDITTKISIRIGTFGDESKSRQILESIQSRLS